MTPRPGTKATHTDYNYSYTHTYRRDSHTDLQAHTHSDLTDAVVLKSQTAASKWLTVMKLKFILFLLSCCEFRVSLCDDSDPQHSGCSLHLDYSSVNVLLIPKPFCWDEFTSHYISVFWMVDASEQAFKPSLYPRDRLQHQHNPGFTMLKASTREISVSSTSYKHKRVLSLNSWRSFVHVFT